MIRRAINLFRRLPLLFIARALGLGVFVLVILIDALGFIALLSLIGEPCQERACLTVMLSIGEAARLAQFGITPQIFGGLVLFIETAASLTWVVVALLIFWRRPGDWFAFIGSLALLTFGSIAFSPLYNQAAPHDPILTLAMRYILGLGEISFAFFFVFPDGRFIPRWTRWAAVLWLLVWLPAFFLPFYNPLAVIKPFPLLVLFVLAVLAAQIHRYHSVSGPLERLQTRWVVFSLALVFGYFLTMGVLVSLPQFSGRYFLIRLAMEIVFPVLGALIPLGFGVSMLRYRLWDIDLLIRRTLVYGLLTALLALFYFGGVVLSQQIFRYLTGASSPIAVVLITLAVAGLFSPLRSWVQRGIDRRFYRQKYDADRTLETFTSAIRSDVDLESLSSRLLLAAQDTLQPESSSLWLRVKK